VGGMEAAAGMVVDGTAAVGMEDGMAAAGTEDGGVAGAVGVVAGTEAGGMEEVGGPDMATAGMVLVILIGAGTAAVGGRVGAADTGAADGGVVSTEAGTAVTGVSRSGFFSEPLAFSGGSHRLILVQAFSNPLGIDVDKKAGSAGWIRIFGFR
jgi:hypothetical protein